MEKGKIEQEALDRYHSLLLFLKDFLDWTNAKMAKYARWEEKRVADFRALLQKEKEVDKILKGVKKLFFRNIKLSGDSQKEVSQALTKFLK